jgi:FkbM family methyltransferase
MQIKFIIKKFVKRIVWSEIPNLFLRRLVKQFSSITPKNIIKRIPVVGLICLRLPNSKKLYLKTDGHDPIASSLYWGGIDAYESSTIQLFIKLLKYTDTVFDIGAFTGIYALIAAIDNPHRKVYAFEPVPMILDYLKENVRINKIHNLQTNSSAMTNYDGDITLYIPAGAIPTSASTLQGFRNASKAISVQALTIDSFVAINNISRVDLIKIDTEATEHMVLEGAKNTMKRDEPIIICEVLKGRTERFLHSVLDNSGYKYFWISSEGLIEKEQIEGDETYKNRNYLFITKKRIREVMKEIDVS